MTTTPNYNFNLPDINGDEGAWGTKLNANWTSVDSILGGISGQDKINQWRVANGSTALLMGESVRSFQMTSTPIWTLPVVFAIDGDTNYIWVCNGDINGRRIILRPGTGDELFLRGKSLGVNTGMLIDPGETVLILPANQDSMWSVATLSNRDAEELRLMDPADLINGVDWNGITSLHEVSSGSISIGDLVTLVGNKVELYAGAPGTAPYGISLDFNSDASALAKEVLSYGFCRSDLDFNTLSLGNIYGSLTSAGVVTDTRQVGTNLAFMATHIGQAVGNNTIFFNPHQYPHIDEAALDGKDYIRNKGRWNKLIISESKSIGVELPTAIEDISYFFTDVAITITKMRAILVGSSTPSVTWTIRHGTDRSGAGAEVILGGTVTTDVTTGTDITSFNDATIVANSHVWLETTAKSGNVDSINISLFFDED